ncbi:aspartate aminotransferase family protein [Pseudonocardia alni]
MDPTGEASRDWSRSAAAYEHGRRSVGGGAATSVRAGWRPHPLFFTHGSGPRIVDVDGHSYVDHVLGWGPLLLGHAHPVVTAAAHAQLDRGVLFGSSSPAEVTAARRFLAALGWAERMLWTNTGTEAVQIALRLARAHTGRDVVVKLGGGYHGWHDTVLAGYRDYGDDGVARGHSAGQPASALTDLRVARYGDLPGTAALLEREAGRVAAILVDPTSSNTGSVEPPPGYLAGLRALADTHGAVLIFDEVVSGLRLSLAGATGRFGVVPDLATYGKAIGSGIAVAAVAGRGDVVDLVTRGVVHSGTFNGNPLATAAVLATLDVLGADGVYPALDRAAVALADDLRAVAVRAGHVVDVRALGATVVATPGVERVAGPDDFLRADPTWWSHELIPRMLAHGIYLLPGGRLFLSTEHGAAEHDETVAAFAAVLTRIRPPVTARPPSRTATHRGRPTWDSSTGRSS